MSTFQDGHCLFGVDGTAKENHSVPRFIHSATFMAPKKSSRVGHKSSKEDSRIRRNSALAQAEMEGNGKSGHT